LKRKTNSPVQSSKPAPKAPAELSVTELSFRTRVRNNFFKMVYAIDQYKKWSWRASRVAIAAGKEHQARLVLSSAPPHTMLIAGTLAAKRLGVPHIADLRDPWTDNIPDIPLAPGEFGLSLLRHVEGWVIKSAGAVTSTGASVAKILSDRYPIVRSRMHVIRNGFDGGLEKVSPDTGGRLSILFAGELYVKRNPFPIMSALEKLLARPDVDGSRVTMTFMGRCATYNDRPLADWLSGKRCEANVKILPQMPADAVAAAIRDSTVLLNLAQQQPLSVPAKTFEHIASGREILLICEDDSDTAQVVKGIQGVLQIDQSNEQALENALLDLYQRHVVQGKLTTPTEAQAMQYSRENVNEQFLSVMRSVADLS
jgi:Glycosyltransferase Family 4